MNKPFAQKNWAPQASLDDALAVYRECGEAQLLGEEAVAGRPTYVVAVTPRSGCQQFTRTIWVDRETLLAMKVESRDATGTVRAESAIQSFELDITIPRSRFDYMPPPGAIISGD